MLSKISPAENAGRLLSASQRKTSRQGRSTRHKESSSHPNKRTSVTHPWSALEAHGDIGQPNNDDVADCEVWILSFPPRRPSMFSSTTTGDRFAPSSSRWNRERVFLALHHRGRTRSRGRKEDVCLSVVKMAWDSSIDL